MCHLDLYPPAQSSVDAAVSTTTIAQFSRDGRGFGAAALERARAAGLSDDTIRQQVPQAGLVLGPKAAAALGVALDEAGDQA